MKTLQKLIQDKIDGGKSLRRISEECGVEFKSLHNYLNKGTEPRGKNLSLLADYFHVHFADLMDEYVPTGRELSPIKKDLLDALSDATDEEVSAVLSLLRKRRKAD